MADDFRATNYTTTNGLYPNVDEGIKYMSKKPNNWGGIIPLSINEHYFRNELNIDLSWEEFQILNERLPDNMKWTTVIADLHQNNIVNDKKNIKYVSADGHFELIYNGNNILLTSKNNPDDMGTYNYYSPINKKICHVYYDVIPYLEFGNVR